MSVYFKKIGVGLIENGTIFIGLLIELKSAMQATLTAKRKQVEGKLEVSPAIPNQWTLSSSFFCAMLQEESPKKHEKTKERRKF